MRNHAEGQVSPLENALLAVTAIHLCFLPWALGGMHIWAQLVSAGFALTGFALALFPRKKSPAINGNPPPPQPPFRQLLRFPLFWIGLVLLAYIAVQALNPSWRFTRNETTWWLEPASAITWLPSSIDAPFSRSNPWRAFIVLTSLWLLACSMWIGFAQRRSLRRLLVTLAANGFLLALLGVLQELTGSKRIFWSYLPANDAFAASFIYRNHGGAYLNLMVALGAGLAWWYFERKQRRREKSSPAGLFALFAALAGFMVVLSSSRTSIVLLLTFTAILIGVLLVRIVFSKDRSNNTGTLVVLALLIAAFAGTAVVTLQTGKVRQRFDLLAADPTGTSLHRTLARRAAADMLNDRWLLGWGAGCFRHGFPIYASRYPEIYESEISGRRKFWEHAHNDLLQFPLELGLAGMLPVISGLTWSAWRLLRLRFWRNVLALPVTLGCALLLAHAGVDFVLQNPAILLTAGILLLSTIRWLEFEPSRG